MHNNKLHVILCDCKIRVKNNIIHSLETQLWAQFLHERTHLLRFFKVKFYGKIYFFFLYGNSAHLCTEAFQILCSLTSRALLLAITVYSRTYAGLNSSLNVKQLSWFVMCAHKINVVGNKLNFSILSFMFRHN